MAEGASVIPAAHVGGCGCRDGFPLTTVRLLSYT